MWPLVDDVRRHPWETTKAPGSEDRGSLCSSVWWAMPGLNRRPLPCQGSALPLRQPPEVETGFEPVYTALQAVASPLGHATASPRRTPCERTTGFEPATLTLAR